MSSRGAAPGAPLIAHREAINDRLDDWRAEDVHRLLRDARRACKRWAPRSMPKADHDPLAADAVCLILQWEVSGTRGADGADGYVIRCGAKDCAPPRVMWRSSDDWREPSNAAWIVLHRAILQACKAPRRIGWRPAPKEGETTRPVEVPTDPGELDRIREMAPTTVAALGAAHAETEARNGEADYSPIPDDVTVKDLAEACEIPVRPARAFIAKALGASARDLAPVWGMTEASAEVAISSGAKWIRDRYPDTPEGLRELAALLASGAQTIRVRRRAELVEARAKLTRGEITIGAAQRAAFAYLESSRTAPRTVRAIEESALAALQRIGADADDAPKLARVVRLATDGAKLGEYRRLAASVLTTYRGASDAILDWSELHALEAPSARRETDVEREARNVPMPVRRARKFTPDAPRGRSLRVIGRCTTRPAPRQSFTPDLPKARPAPPCPVCGKVHPIGYPEGIHPVRGAA